MAEISSNPFRDPQLRSQRTGTNVQLASPGIGTSAGAGTGTSSDNGANGAAADLLIDIGSEDPPPAYTLVADTIQGELPVQFGPRHPFQPAPLQPLIPTSAPIPVPVTPSTPAPTHTPGSSISPSLSSQRRSSRSSSSEPPPRHPDTVPPTNSPSIPQRPRLHTQTSQRQVSTTPTAVYSPPPSPPPSLVQPTTYLPPPSPPPQARTRSYSPPPGPPDHPTTSSAHLRNVSTSSVGVSTSRDDGRPTTTPMPGHPLLRDGKLLVYPPGHECPKCHNTGFKNYDPSHPCRKCWDKYARPYTGALAYAPFPPTSSGSGNNFQRPLPVFRPPHAAPPRPISTAGYPGLMHRTQQQQQQQLAPVYAPPSHPPPQPYHPPTPALAPPPVQGYFPPPGLPNAHHNHHGHQGNSHHGHHHERHRLERRRSSSASRHSLHVPQPAFVPAPPPMPTQSSVVLPPGDPRLGGQLCWQCGGRGTVIYMFFDGGLCGACKGVGRVY